ncbi:MAG: hypothetical protein K8Q89_07200 [Nitrosarchaeum sp.]|nr:hypothetical protein [Nitrosarchaeum sp.]
MIFEKLTSFGVLFAILVIAITSGIFAEEFSFASQSVLNDLSVDEFSISAPVGHVEDVSFVQQVSPTGTIEIGAITFTLVADDPNIHLFQVCATLEGPSGVFSPSIDTNTCTNAELQGNKLSNQSINFLNGVNVSDIVGISLSVKEI